jgi:hypothetical protein
LQKTVYREVFFVKPCFLHPRHAAKAENTAASCPTLPLSFHHLDRVLCLCKIDQQRGSKLLIRFRM